MWTVAFGSGSLFHESVAGLFQRPGEKPCAASELSLPGCEGLSVATASMEVLRGLCRSRGSTCYVIVVCQILLRLPNLIAWLGWHENNCEAGEACAACLLCRTRLQFGGKALPELLLRRGAVDEVFDDAAHHEPLAFCAAVLEAMRHAEVLAGRCAVWPGVDVVSGVVATHVDRLFAFVGERRLRCKVCGAGRVQYERLTQLHLPAPSDHARKRSLYDAYLEYCAPDGGATASCPRCCTERPHVAQRRLATVPDVLLVQVLRTSAAGALARYHFCVDEQTSLPGLGCMNLAAIMFHFGRRRETGHYTCACRGPDGGFWHFDDAREPVAVRSVVGFFDRNVDALVYVRPGVCGQWKSEVRTGGAGGKGVVSSGADVEAVRKHLETIRGPGGIAPTASTSSVEDGAGALSAVVEGLRVFAHRLWGERSFRSLLFDDPVYAEELVASLSEPLSGDALDFCYFAEACREYGLGPSAFESRGEQQGEGTGRGDTTVCGKMSAGRGTQDVRARRVALAFACRRRCEMEAKARLFSKAQAAAAAALGGRSVSSGGAVHGVEPAGSESRAEGEAGGSGRGAAARGVQKAAPASTSHGRCEIEAKVALFSQGRPLVDGAPRAASSRGVARDVRGAARDGGRIRDSILETPLCRKLRALRLDGDIVDAVLAEMQRLFGQGLAWDLAGAEWLLEWGRWEVFVEEVQRAAGSWSEGLLVHHVHLRIEEFLFALRRVVAAQVEQGGAERTNEGALEVLRAAGFQRGVGRIWGENDCLADSLLQLLIFHGVVADDVDRKTACLANRVRLEAQEDLVPRDIDGCVDFGGFLQHHRHARPTVEFFLEWFGCSGEVLPVAGFRLVVHARSDDEAHPADEMVICEGCGRRAGPCLDCHLFSWTGELHEGYHYDPLLLVPLLVDLAGTGDGGGDPGAVVSKSRRVLRRQKAMDCDEHPTALEALGHRAGAGDGGVEDAGAAAGRERAGAEGGSNSTRVLKRNAEIGADFDVAPLVAAVARLGLGGADVEMSPGRTPVEANGDLPNDSVTEKPVAASTPEGALAMSVLGAQMDAVCGGTVSPPTPGAQGRAEEPYESALPAGGGRVGKGLPFLFEDSLVDASKCLARTWVNDAAKAVFAQCAKPRTFGDFCGRHKTEMRRPQGVWDPPAHVALPPEKLKEATPVAERRALAGARSTARPSEGGGGAQPRSKGKGAPVPERSQEGGGEAQAQRERRGKGRGGCGGRAQTSAAAVGGSAADRQRASSRPGAVSTGASPASLAGPAPSAGRSGGPLLKRRAGDGDAGCNARARQWGAGVSGVGVSVPGAQSTRRRADLASIHAENEYVDQEMRRRGFQLRRGQWQGGQMLPGEPQDVNLREDFLRAEFRRARSEEDAHASQQWGCGRRLGD